MTNFRFLRFSSVDSACSQHLAGRFGSHEFSVQGSGVLAVVVLAMVWLMNVYNFMDGSNGMAGFQGVFAGVTMAVLFQSAVSMRWRWLPWL